MHRSRLHVVLLDTPSDRADEEVSFWAAALGGEPAPEAGTPFTSITHVGPVLLAHQRLEQGPARVHLDIETDDTAAEVARLQGLGATRVGEHHGCVHLRDPAGLVFCVVPVQSEDFGQRATTWG